MSIVLIIDDDALVRRTISRLLVGPGREVVEAENGLEGLEVLRHKTVDLVITDIIMPQQDGIETIRAIRKVSPVPIIAISGVAMSGSPDEFDQLKAARELGADLAIRKPFAPNALIAAVEQLLPAVPREPSPRGARSRRSPAKMSLVK